MKQKKQRECSAGASHIQLVCIHYTLHSKHLKHRSGAVAGACPSLMLQTDHLNQLQ